MYVPGSSARNEYVAVPPGGAPTVSGTRSCPGKVRARLTSSILWRVMSTVLPSVTSKTGPGKVGVQASTAGSTTVKPQMGIGGEPSGMETTPSSAQRSMGTGPGGGGGGGGPGGRGAPAA